jgi:hypothetical protein
MSDYLQRFLPLSKHLTSHSNYGHMFELKVAVSNKQKSIQDEVPKLFWYSDGGIT